MKKEQANFKVGDYLSKYEDGKITTRIVKEIKKTGGNIFDSYTFESQPPNISNLSLSVSFVDQVYTLTSEMKEKNPEYFL